MLFSMMAWSGADALVIYRFGGQDMDPPPEVEKPGVDFVPASWQELDGEIGGNARDVEFSKGKLAPLKRDPDVNIAPTAEENGGIYIHGQVNAQVWDGDTSTVWMAAPYLCANVEAYWHRCGEGFGTLGTANVLLDGLYQIDRIRVVSGLRNPGRTVQSLRVFLAPSEAPGRPSHWRPSPYFPWIVEVRDNREQVLDIPIPPHEEAGFVQVTIGEHTDEWEVNDIHIYAKGFVQRSTYTSNLIDFGGDMAWGELRWSGWRGDRARVLIQSRSGRDDTPLQFWRFTGSGQDREVVTKKGYGELGLGEKAGTTHDQENWDFWSTYDFDDSLGTQIVSTSPRRFFQFQVDFLPQEDDGGEVSFLEFRASKPLVSALIGEVWPIEAEPGKTTDFTYALLPTIAPGDAGFDRIDIQSTSLLGEVREVRTGDVPVPHTVEAQESHLLAVGIPPLDSGDTGALVELDFTARVLRFGAGFDARVWNSKQPPEVPQSVNPGDATGEFEGNRVSVATTMAGSGPLLRFHAPSAMVTPNRDGANEEARLLYDILEITGLATVRMEIRDLAGRRIRLVHEGKEGIGSYERHWDGREDGRQAGAAGNLPGDHVRRY